MVLQHIDTLVFMFGGLEVGKINFMVSKMVIFNNFGGQFFQTAKNSVNSS